MSKTTKSSKQQSKLKRTLAWFKPTSAKKGALLFAIAFAIIGGSYMAYKSFAATKHSLVYTYDNKGLTADGPATIIAESQKSNSKIISAKPGTSVKISAAIGWFWDKTVSVCAMVKSTPGGGQIRINGINSDYTSANNPNIFNVTSNYTQYCTPPEAINSSTLDPTNFYTYFQNVYVLGGPGVASVEVSYISVNFD